MREGLGTPRTLKGRRDLTLESNQAGCLSAGNGVSMTLAQPGFPPFSLKNTSQKNIYCMEKSMADI